MKEKESRVGYTTGDRIGRGVRGAPRVFEEFRSRACRGFSAAPGRRATTRPKER